MTGHASEAKRGARKSPPADSTTPTSACAPHHTVSLLSRPRTACRIDTRPEPQGFLAGVGACRPPRLTQKWFGESAGYSGFSQ